MIKEFKDNGIKKVHFIGIGGVSMSSLAKYVKMQGYEVSGSDRNKPEEDFDSLGIKVYTGHCADNVKDADAVVYNSAINFSNAEIVQALKDKKRLYMRSQLLSIICEDFGQAIGIAGCHGKTTVSSMIAKVFKDTEQNFYAHIGGYDNELGNAYYSGNDYIISEVCEYKRNIRYFQPHIACLLNISPDHMDCYNSLDDLRIEYFGFLDRAYIRIINGDDAIARVYGGDNTVTFGIGENNVIRATNIQENFGLYSFDIICGNKEAGRVSLNIYGKHSVYNALAAYSVCKVCGIKDIDIINSLNDFKGVKRRFEKIGQINGAAVIADYAHHPDEIAESICTAQSMCRGKVYIAFQPHTFSRTKFLFNDFIKCFKNIDNIAIFKTFSARENPSDGYSGEYLSKHLPSSLYFDDIDIFYDYEKQNLKCGDMLLLLGAGNIYNLVKDKLSK